MPSTRRAFLVSLGTATATLSGCSGASAPDDESDEPTTQADSDDATPTHTPPRSTPTSSTSTPTPNTVRRSVGQRISVDGMAVTVANPRVRRIVVWQGKAHDRLRHEDGPYLLVDVRGIEEFEPLGVVLDGQIQNPETVYQLANVPPFQTPPDGTYQRYPTDGEYVPGVALPVPVGKPNSAAVRWAGEDRHAYWELDAETRERMARVAEFELESYAIAVGDDRTVDVHVTVTNTGDRDGIWLAQYSTEGFSGSTSIGIPVPAGETKAKAFETVEPASNFSGELTVQFETAGKEVTRRVTVPEATPTETPTETS